MLIDQLSNIMRPVLYMLIAMMNFMLANLYFQANKRRKKKSRIIKWNVYYLASLTIFFAALSIIPIVRLVSLEAYLTITRHFYVFTAPVLVSVWLLWKSVVNDNDK